MRPVSETEPGTQPFRSPDISCVACIDVTMRHMLLGAPRRVGPVGPHARCECGRQGTTVEIHRRIETAANQGCALRLAGSTRLGSPTA